MATLLHQFSTLSLIQQLEFLLAVVAFFIGLPWASGFALMKRREAREALARERTALEVAVLEQRARTLAETRIAALEQELAIQQLNQPRHWLEDTHDAADDRALSLVEARFQESVGGLRDATSFLARKYLARFDEDESEVDIDTALQMTRLHVMLSDDREEARALLKEVEIAHASHWALGGRGDVQPAYWSEIDWILGLEADPASIAKAMTDSAHSSIESGSMFPALALARRAAKIALKSGPHPNYEYLRARC